MIPLSCSNCSYNALQYGSLGLSVGHCAEHGVVLRRADETTCARHLRKDLGRESREQAHLAHGRSYPLDVVQSVHTAAPVATELEFVDPDTQTLESDVVGSAVADYGALGSKIATLAQLKTIPGVRAELALLSLGRAYVRRCVMRQGPWTSGLHLLWWSRQRLADAPDVRISDIRRQTAARLERQAELAAWSVVILRLRLIADVAASAPKEEGIFPLVDLIEAAAEASETPDLPTLLQWLKGEGARRVEGAFPVERYKWWRTELHKSEVAD